MKTIYVFLSLGFCFVSDLSFAQVNSYFQNNPVWQNTSSCAVPLPCIQNETYNYYIIGDTIINSLTYKKIFKKGQGSYNWMAPPPSNCSGTYSYIDTVPSYFLRSLNKQMFLLQPNDTSEYFLYDFNLAVGDTLPMSFNNYATDITVTAIDSIFTPYGYRKRFTLAGSTWSTYLLEGIGHSKGLIEPLNIPFECGYNLECYSLNDSAYYPGPGPSCNLTVGIFDHEMKLEAKVFPNPFTEQTQIILTQNVNNAECSIYNVTGEKIRNAVFSGNNFTFDRKDLSSGIYFYQIQMGNTERISGKLILID